MEVIIDADCGNAPKKLQVRDWLVAVASADTEAAGSLLTDDVVCDLASGDAVTGRAGVLDALVGRPARELVVSNLLSHGKHVAAEGRITRDPRDDKCPTWCALGPICRIERGVAVEDPEAEEDAAA